MEKIIEHMKDLDYLVDHYDAGNFIEGTIVALMQTLHKTNTISQNKHMVIIIIFLKFSVTQHFIRWRDFMVFTYSKSTC
jgi:branched-subunit amino acid transport protein AzlD